MAAAAVRFCGGGLCPTAGVQGKGADPPHQPQSALWQVEIMAAIVVPGPVQGTLALPGERCQMPDDARLSAWTRRSRPDTGEPSTGRRPMLRAPHHLAPGFFDTQVRQEPPVSTLTQSDSGPPKCDRLFNSPAHTPSPCTRSRSPPAHLAPHFRARCTGQDCPPPIPGRRGWWKLLYGRAGSRKLPALGLAHLLQAGIGPEALLLRRLEAWAIAVGVGSVLHPAVRQGAGQVLGAACSTRDDSCSHRLVREPGECRFWAVQCRAGMAQEEDGSPTTLVVREPFVHRLASSWGWLFNMYRSCI